MSVKAVNLSDTKQHKYRNSKSVTNALAKSQSKNQPSFQGLEVVPIGLANMLYRGGFIASFIAQDACGMAIPRVIEGINRRPVNPETGKKEGPYNWAFARREGIREVLSGPSAYLIPLGILGLVKKYSGTTNNVPVNMIQGYGNNFLEYMSKDPERLENVAKTKKEFYNNIFKNVLNTTLEGKLTEEELQTLANSYTDRAIEIELAKDNKKSIFKKLFGIKVEGSPEDLTQSLLDDFMKMKKQYLSASTDELVAEMVINPDKFGKPLDEMLVTDKAALPFKKLLSTLTDFTDDLLHSTGKAIERYKNKDFDSERFLKDFISRRTGSRIVTNVGMWSAVVGFYALIPTLYSLGLKGKNPAFMTEKKLEEEKNTKTQNKIDDKDKNKFSNSSNVSFSGREKFFTNTANKVLKSERLSSLLNHLEFDGASMSLSGMMALLYGFCLPTRLLKAPDKYDRKETWTRDFSSFTAILFAAEAISKACSKLFSKITGFALNVTPTHKNPNIFTKIADYVWPFGGIKVLNNEQLGMKYTHVENYKDGINGFFDFVVENGGNLRKMLSLNKQVTENVKIIVGKDLKDVADDNEIRQAFRNISTESAEKAKETIVNILKDSKNTYVKSAKLFNSAFTFLSTILLVPSFMVWLARKCDRMTRETREKDLAQKQQYNNPVEQKIHGIQSVAVGPKVSMQGFLAN